jgi:hypothetical protein
MVPESDDLLWTQGGATLSFDAVQAGGREGGIGQEVQNPDNQQHQARRAYRAAFLQFKMVSISKRARTGYSGSYSGGAVLLPCKLGRLGGRERGIGQEVQNLDKQQHQARRAYRAAFLQSKMVSDSKGVTQAVQLCCRASRDRVLDHATSN